MKIYSHKITFNDAPFHNAALSLWIPGCIRKPKCKGCHSSFLWYHDNGDEFNFENFTELYNKYKELIEAIVFLGSDYYENEIFFLSQKIKNTYKNLSLYFYTSKEIEEVNYLKYFDYIKTGYYDIEHQGGYFGSTNQKIYKNNNGEWIEVEVPNSN